MNRTYCEHPNWEPDFGSWYVSQVVDILASNPEVWSKMALFITYDEEGGFFDHLVPPTPPHTREQGRSTVEITNEIFAGDSGHSAGPYGLGVRVPMLVISPWSKGGWVNSELFDHTSLVRFEDFERHPDYVPVPPVHDELPRQETGVRPARALPYTLDALGAVAEGSFWIQFWNTGRAGAVFHVRSGNSADGPRTYTVEPHKHLLDSWRVGESDYDLSVFGPNGFYRAFKGSVSSGHRADLDVRAKYDEANGSIALEITNQASHVARISVVNRYTLRRTKLVLGHGESYSNSWSLTRTSGWYDLAITVDGDAEFQYHLAGHLENGEDSISDPIMGGLV